jgi:magnesium chelatase family protein
MLFKSRSAAVYGIDASIIDVEVDFSGVVEKSEFSTVGLPDAAVRESRDRVRSAIKNSGFDLPPPASPSTSPLPTSRRRAPASTCP